MKSTAHALVLALALALPLPAAGQSDETCISYMEADDAFREAQTSAFLDPAYGAAYAGPTSDNPRVMARLATADRQRCRVRGM